MIRTAFLAVIASGVAVPALADPTTLVGQPLGMSVADVATTLEAAGYEIIDFDIDERDFEIEVRWNEARYDIEMERATGTVRKVERD